MVRGPPTLYLLPLKLLSSNHHQAILWQLWLASHFLVLSTNLGYMFADIEADFTMHLGRSGEAYFVGEDDVIGECILTHC